MTAEPRLRIDRFRRADGGQGVTRANDRWDAAFALTACLLGAVVRPGAGAAAPTHPLLLRVAPRAARDRSHRR